MTTEQVLQLLALVLAVGGSQALATRWLLGRIAKVDEDGRRRAEALHARINDVRDSYVRREDLMVHIRRIERGQEALAGAIDRLHHRMDGLIAGRVPERE